MGTPSGTAACVRARLVVVALAVLWPVVVWAQVYPSPLRFEWDASDGATGYSLILDGVKTDVGNVTTSPPIPLADGAHVVAVTAYDAPQGVIRESAPSSPLAFQVGQIVDPNCTPPLGNRVVGIVVTQLQKTGSGGALSLARLDIRLASPNSPVTHVAIRTNGADLAVMDGTDLTALAGLWFQIPATSGTYPLSVRASNLYGCVNDADAKKTVTVP